jgi:hypothetical protein
MLHNVLLASLVMACVAAAAVVGNAADEEWGGLVGTAVGLAVGFPLAVLGHRRRAQSPGG